MAGSGQQKEVVKLRFSKAKASVLALSLSLAVSGSVFAATSGEEEDSIGWSELQEDASNYDWTISLRSVARCQRAILNHFLRCEHIIHTDHLLQNGNHFLSGTIHDHHCIGI